MAAGTRSRHIARPSTDRSWDWRRRGPAAGPATALRPILASNARRYASIAPVKTRPPAVIATPLTSGVPQLKASPSGARSSAGADRRMPEDFAGLEVDRDHLAPRRPVAEQAKPRCRQGARHRKRRAALQPEIMAGRRLNAFRFRARHQFDDMQRVTGVGIEDLVDRIERRAAPVHPATGHRIDQRPLRRRRRVEPLIAQGRQLRVAGPAADDRQL